jgi:ADP-heptose:LPS heptosyltransferase
MFAIRARLYNSPLMLVPARSILAIDGSPFGQSIAMLPVTRSIRASYPGTFLAAAAAAGTCDLLTADGVVDCCISLGVVRTSPGGQRGALKRLVGLFRAARRYDFDLILDFSPSLETQIVSRLASRARVFTPSKGSRVIGMLLELGAASRFTGRGARSDYTSVLRQAGVDMNDIRLAIRLPFDEDRRFEQRLTNSGSRGGELIGLLYASNPNGARSWPVAAFADIGTRLANNFGARIVAADEPTDHTFTRAVSAGLPPGSIKLTEPRALELIAAISRASIVITDAPAIAQIASELGTPVIEIVDAMSTAPTSSTTHRIARGSWRSSVPADEIYEIASEMIQENRSPSLFQRP